MKRSRSDSDNSDSDSDSQISSASSNKKKKTADVLANRSKEYWYKDGTVVISLERTLYKLYAGRLARCSSYFAQVLQVSEHRSAGYGLVDGVPLHTLKVGVSATDFNLLLRVVEDGSALALGSTSLTYTETASILQASSALGFDALFQSAKAAVAARWSSELEDLAVPVPSSPGGGAAAALVLAEKYDMPAIRKRCLYELLRLEDFGCGAPKDAPEPVEAEPELSREHLLALMRTRQQWQNTLFALLEQPPMIPARCGTYSCPGERAQDIAVFQRGPLVTRPQLMKQALLDPLHAIELMETDCARREYCMHCKGERQAWAKEMRTKVWRDMDVWFGTDA
ncbi:hypothetical protein BDW22DRAFT_677496 [Trametopsis cervina]|nr:hypothetical protein BDW22DRAFT_677496 [Trametopsis cervina]